MTWQVRPMRSRMVNGPGGLGKGARGLPTALTLLNIQIAGPQIGRAGAEWRMDKAVTADMAFRLLAVREEFHLF